MAKKFKSFPTSLRLPADIDEAIEDMAVARGLDRSTVLRSLLRRALNLPEPTPIDPLACDPKIEKNT